MGLIVSFVELLSLIQKRIFGYEQPEGLGMKYTERVVFVKRNKITFRDGFFLFSGILLGMSLAFLWLLLGVTSAIDSIPMDSINVEVDFNETELVEASFEWMNKTGQLPEKNWNCTDWYNKGEGFSYPK